LSETLKNSKDLAKDVVSDYLKNKNVDQVLKLWKYFAMKKLIDYRMPKPLARKIQVEVFECGLLPFSDLDYNACREISKVVMNT